MGGAASVFKLFCLRLIRRRGRDRWVRDDRTRLLSESSETRQSLLPTHHVTLPKHIDQRVIDDIQQQVLNRRRVEQPGWTIHDDIHRRQLVAMRCGLLPPSLSERESSIAGESFDSMASWIREGTEKLGINFYSVEGTEGSFIAGGTTDEDEDDCRDEYDPCQWVRYFGDPENVDTMTKIDEEEKEGTITGDEDDEMAGTMTGEDEGMVSDEGTKDDVGGVVDAVQRETTSAYALERLAVMIHTCSSGDASWCKDILS